MWVTCHHKPHPPCCVTLFCCTGCRSWRQCWTRGAASAAGTGPVGTASEGWSRGSGWPGLNQCAGYNQWDRKSRKKKQCNIYFCFSPATSGQVWPRGNEITVSKWSFLLPKKDIILSRVDDPRWCRAHMWIRLWGRLVWSSSRVGSGAAWSPCSRRSWWQCC